MIIKLNLVNQDEVGLFISKDSLTKQLVFFSNSQTFKGDISVKLCLGNVWAMHTTHTNTYTHVHTHTHTHTHTRTYTNTCTHTHAHNMLAIWLNPLLQITSKLKHCICTLYIQLYSVVDFTFFNVYGTWLLVNKFRYFFLKCWGVVRKYINLSLLYFEMYNVQCTCTLHICAIYVLLNTLCSLHHFMYSKSRQQSENKWTTSSVIWAYV